MASARFPRRRRLHLRDWLHLLAFTVAILAGWQGGDIVLAAQTYTIVQHDRSFNYKKVPLTIGDTLQFANHDEFIHQVYVESPTFNFDTAESSPGDHIDIRFTAKGEFEVRCHIHPKMLLVVIVG
jgi:plastocyanin